MLEGKKMSDMNQALIFMGVCFGLGVGMILWRVVVSQAIRDWKICATAKQARKTKEPIEVTLSHIQIPGKFCYRPDDRHLDIQSDEKHWYFTDCTFSLASSVVINLEDASRGAMYTAETEDFVACFIEADKRVLLGTLSLELPKVESWKKHWFYN
jgi:hypothetical protein